MMIGRVPLRGPVNGRIVRLVEEAARRAALFDALRDRDRPPHIGVLLDNIPDYLFWLAAAAVSGRSSWGSTPPTVAISSGQLIRHTDCQLLVHLDQSRAAPRRRRDAVSPATGSPRRRRTTRRRWPSRGPCCQSASVDEEDLFLLIFTSGSTGLPKAVRCTQGRFARTGAHVAAIAELSRG